MISVHSAESHSVSCPAASSRIQTERVTVNVSAGLGMATLTYSLKRPRGLVTCKIMSLTLLLDPRGRILTLGPDPESSIFALNSRSCSARQMLEEVGRDQVAGQALPIRYWKILNSGPGSNRRILEDIG